MEKSDIKKQYDKIANILLKERNKHGFWDGELSSSALSTAVAIVAFKINDDQKHAPAIDHGVNWLLNNVNTDGGFGDTSESESNISTSLLCYAAIHLCGKDKEAVEPLKNHIQKYLKTQNIELSSNSITKSILDYYGKDFTFSVPILTMLCVCGILDKSAFNKIPQLPFEFSVLPTRFYQLFNLQVVSYAIPALIAVGIAIFKHRTKGNWIMKTIRKIALNKSLKKLESLVPESGGFLEAIPLTGFVNLCLNFSGYSKSKTVASGISFLKNQQREDGSWPIDTNLSTWVTTLSIKAFGKDIKAQLTDKEIDSLRKHLLNNQYKTPHPFNDAKPGGWGWTNYSGSVPDGDDTSGAIVALTNIFNGTEEEKTALKNGVDWLLGIQNHDGGIPTFSKGWGKLPFDASCADITGHAILALSKSLHILKVDLTLSEIKIWSARLKKMILYLLKHQSKDGHWVPLWFGNQNAIKKDNKIYGTARVTSYLKDSLDYLDLSTNQKLKAAINKAQDYIIKQQNNDGSWGSEFGIEGTIEETSLAISALDTKDSQNEIDKGFAWLESKMEITGLKASPIGLYFATLWYHEKLYPHSCYLEALRRQFD